MFWLEQRNFPTPPEMVALMRGNQEPIKPFVELFGSRYDGWMKGYVESALKVPSLVIADVAEEVLRSTHAANRAYNSRVYPDAPSLTNQARRLIARILGDASWPAPLAKSIRETVDGMQIQHRTPTFELLNLAVREMVGVAGIPGVATDVAGSLVLANGSKAFGLGVANGFRYSLAAQAKLVSGVSALAQTGATNAVWTYLSPYMAALVAVSLLLIVTLRNRTKGNLLGYMYIFGDRSGEPGMAYMFNPGLTEEADWKREARLLARRLFIQSTSEANYTAMYAFNVNGNAEVEAGFQLSRGNVDLAEMLELSEVQRNALFWSFAQRLELDVPREN